MGKYAMLFRLEVLFFMSDSLNHFLANNERQAFRMAQLATAHRDDALDIVQNSMIKLVEKYADRDADQWGPLFHRIVQRQITDWYRRKKVKQQIFGIFHNNQEPEGSYFEGHQDPVERVPDKLLQSEQAINVLEQALQQLPMRQRQAFLLRCWQGMSTKQTAQAMGCSDGSVKTHYHRALSSLRTVLGETWP